MASVSRKPDYQTGFRKCKGCCSWDLPCSMQDVGVSKFSRAELDRHFAWSRDNGREDPTEVSMCSDWVVGCVRCGGKYHRENALAYGICLDCNRALGA